MKKYIIIFFATILAYANSANAQSAKISGTLDFLHDGDTVQVEVYKYFPLWNVPEFNTYYTTIVKGHSFSFHIPATDTPKFFFLGFNNLQKDIRTMLVQAGDSVTMTEVNDRYQFTGRNAATYNAVIQLGIIYKKYMYSGDFLQPDQVLHSLYAYDTVATEQVNYLDKVKNEMSPLSWKLMRMNSVSDNMFKAAITVTGVTQDKWAPFITLFKTYKPNKYIETAIESFQTDTPLIITSQTYLSGIVTRFYRDSCFMQNRPIDNVRCYDYLKSNYHGIVREALVTYLLFVRKGSYPNLKESINDALGFVHSFDFRNVLLNMKKTMVKGSPAYDFNLTDEKGGNHNAKEFLGKVVLMDFWYTGCPSCAETAPFLKHVEEQFKGMPIVFITVNSDKYRSQWLKSIGSGIYTGQYNINLFTDGLGLQHPIYKYYQINGFPTLILIDKNGKRCDPVPDPRSDNGAGLINEINREL